MAGSVSPFGDPEVDTGAGPAPAQPARAQPQLNYNSLSPFGDPEVVPADMTHGAPTGTTASAVRGFLSTIPFADRINGGLNVVGQALTGNFSGNAYEEGKKKFADLSDYDSQNNPVARLGGQAGGIASIGALTSGLGEAPALLGPVTQSGLLGSAYGLSNSKDLTDVPQDLKQTAIGTGLGVGGGLAGAAGGYGLSKAAQGIGWLGDKALQSAHGNAGGVLAAYEGIKGLLDMTGLGHILPLVTTGAYGAAKLINKATGSGPSAGMPIYRFGAAPAAKGLLTPAMDDALVNTGTSGLMNSGAPQKLNGYGP